MPAGWPPASPKTSTQAGRPPITQRRLPHASANRATAPAARQHQSNGNAGRTVSPGGCQCRSQGRAARTATLAARLHRPHGSTGAQRHQLVGNTNQEGKHIRERFPACPIIRRPSEGSSIKMCGVQSNTPSRPAFQKPVSCGFLSPFPWFTQRPFNKPHTFYLATPFRPPSTLIPQPIQAKEPSARALKTI